MVGNRKDNDFKSPSLSNISQITLSSKPTDDNHVATKSYGDSLSEKDRNRRDLPEVFYGQFKEFDNNKVTYLDSITVNRNPTTHNEVSNKIR